MDAFLLILIYLITQNPSKGSLVLEQSNIHSENIPSQVSPDEITISEAYSPNALEEPYVIRWNDDKEREINNLILYLNLITFPEQTNLIVTFHKKTNISSRTKIYNINTLLNYKIYQDPTFNEKLLKTIKNIALCETQNYRSCYKYLFQLLLKYPTFKEEKIKKFQTLFENCDIERKDLIFSYWFVITFPNISVEFFLKYSVEQIKEEILQKPYLKNFYEEKLKHFDLCISKTSCNPITDKKNLKYACVFSFPDNDSCLNPNTTLILVKILQYLDPKDKENKNEIISLISHSCLLKPIFTWERTSSKFYEEISLNNHKILLVYYKVPNTQKIVAFTEASYLKELSSKNPDLMDRLNIKKIYYGACNLACITFKSLNLSDEIQPLTDKEVKDLNKTYGTFILVNPNSFQIPSNYYYSTEQNGVVCIASETGKEVYGLKKLLNINKKILKEINKDFCVETKVFLNELFKEILKANKH